jgi:trans-aconitate methyltransferase
MKTTRRSAAGCSNAPFPSAWQDVLIPDASAGDPRTSFGKVAKTYDEIRPNYPSSMFDDLFRRLPARPRIVEVGPGTGKATRDLLARSATVTAIEIGPEMAARLREVLPSHDLTIVVGDFETVGVDEQSFDALFSATAYHWISPHAQLDRPASLLVPGGVVAVVDLNQVSSPDDHGFFAAAQPIYERYGEGHTGPPAPARDAVDPPMRSALSGDRRFTDVEVRSYDWNQTYSASDHRKLMLSYSSTQMMEPSAREGLLDDMERFVEQHFGGYVTRPIVVTLTTATVAA